MGAVRGDGGGIASAEVVQRLADDENDLSLEHQSQLLTRLHRGVFTASACRLERDQNAFEVE